MRCYFLGVKTWQIQPEPALWWLAPNAKSATMQPAKTKRMTRTALSSTNFANAATNARFTRRPNNLSFIFVYYWAEFE